jgi:hypothetical protein
MHVKARSYLTAGIATLGVGALALAPVQPIPNQIALAPERVISTLAVELAASTIDPITPWVQTFETAAANIETLVQFYLQKPFPLLQAVVANLGTYAAELENGQGDLIPEQIWGNVQTFFQAPWDPGAQITFPVPTGSSTDLATGEYLSNTITNFLPPSTSYNLLFSEIAGQFGSDECQVNGDCLVVQAAPALNFLNNQYSGQLIALVGTLFAPVIQLTKSFTAIGEFFEAGDVIGAINELINIPANVTNAFLNGTGYLDVTDIISQIVPLPVDKVGIELGGLLSPVPYNGGTSTGTKPEPPPTVWTGGTGYDGVTTTVGQLTVPGLPLGFTGSAIGLGQFLGEQLVVTPPPPPPVAAEPEAAKLAAPADISTVAEASVEESAPAVVDVPAEESAPAVADVPAEDPAPAVAEVAAEDPAPAVEELAEVEAAVEAVEASESEPAEAATPAAEDSGPEAADSDKSADDTDRSGGNDRRGAS